MRAWVGLGSNQGQPAEHLREAARSVAELPGVSVRGRSSLYRTEPWGDTDQPDFINAVLEVSTHLAPRELLTALLAIETAMGRRREGRRWGPRPIDIDLLLCGDLRLEESGLTVPHPRMHLRAFVLVPLLELAPEIRIPGRGAAATELARVGGEGVERLAEDW